jgi:hypothetical protein
MFRRGVFLTGAVEANTMVGNGIPRTLKRALLEAGCSHKPAPQHAIHVRIGYGGAADLFAAADGWRAVVGPRACVPQSPGNELSGIFAGALAVAEAFRKSVLQDLVAGRRAHCYDLWEPGGVSPADAKLHRLPTDIWLLGLGNLGQATLFVLGLLPYSDATDVRLLLNDSDVCGIENLGVQILSKPGWIGRPKVRCAAEWAERVGFRTVLSERRFLEFSKPDAEEPRIALVGVDNLETRRRAAAAGFDLLIDAGLGATAREAFDVRLHAFPGRRSPSEAWPANERGDDTAINASGGAPTLRRNVQALLDAGIVDACGAITIEQQAVGVPCTALAAAAMQVAQLVRATQTGQCCDLVDFDLLNSSRAVATAMERPLPPIPASAARDA